MIRGDIRHAWRLLWRNWPASLTIVVTLALGIGANTAVFTVLHAVMFQTLPVGKPNELALLTWTAKTRPKAVKAYVGSQGCPATPDGRGSGCSFSYPEFEALRQAGREAGVFAFVAGREHNGNVGNGVELLRCTFVSGKYFSSLTLQPAAGRFINDDPEDNGGAPVAVVSYQFWQRHGFDGTLIGRGIGVDSAVFTVIGVAPPGFSGLSPGESVDVWIPFGAYADVFRYPASTIRTLFHDPSYWWVTVMARIPGQSRPGAIVKLAEAFRRDTQSLVSVSDRDVANVPVLEVLPGGRGLAALRKAYAQPLWSVMAVVAIVLLLACANVGNMLVSGMIHRNGEFALRISLGASRFQLRRQVIIESLLTAAIGGTLGALLAFPITHAMQTIWSTTELQIHPDLSVLAFTAAVSIACGVVAGSLPASRIDEARLAAGLRSGAGAIKAGARRGLSLQDSLVVSQVAMSVALLMLAAFYVQTERSLHTVDCGFQTNQAVVFGVQPAHSGYRDKEYAQYYSELARRLTDLPGVRSASLSNVRLISGRANTMTLKLSSGAGAQSVPVVASSMFVSPGFFGTMGIPLVGGRDFSPRDTGNTPRVAIVSRNFVQRYMDKPDDPLGRVLTLEGGSNPSQYQIVGIAGDIKYASLREEPSPMIYVALLQDIESWGSAAVEVRTWADPDQMKERVRAAAESGGIRRVPVTGLKTQEEQIRDSIFRESLVSRVVGAFGILALAIATIGIFSAVARSLSFRTKEFGIRAAVGATRANLVSMVVRRGLSVTAGGVLIGAIAGLLILRAVASQLYGIRAASVLAIVCEVGTLVGAAALGALVPACRAVGRDPVASIKYE